MRLSITRYIICSTVFFAFTCRSQINTYFQNNPAWTLTSVCAEMYPCIDNRDYSYYASTDTLIGSYTYKKIYEKGQGYYSWNAPPPSQCTSSGTYTYVNNDASFFLRSVNQKIFVRQPNDTNDYLLYDFNLSVGDSLPVSFNNYDNAIKVTAIDSVYTPYGYRKRFTLSGNTWVQYLIEGVGTDKGLIETMQAGFDCGYHLNCYSLSNNAYYPSMGSSCELTVGIGKEESDLSFKISPNPLVTAANLQFKTIIGKGELIVRDLYGQKIRSISVISTDQILIERGNLIPGIYVISLKQNGNICPLGKLAVSN